MGDTPLFRSDRVSAIDVAGRFTAALDSGRQDPDLLPGRLVRAAARVLPADGVGLSIHVGWKRTPLAGSGDFASAAERLQFTTGRGPCLLAAWNHQTVLADAEQLSGRWPAYYELLVALTPIRAVLAIPLSGVLGGMAVMDLFFADPKGPNPTTVSEAGVISELVSRQLNEQADGPGAIGEHVYRWLGTEGARRRSDLWIAVGMIMLTRDRGTDEALELLRACAYAAGRSVDDLAEDLISRRLDPEDLGDAGGR